VLFLEHKLNLTYHDARYADLYEETLFNAILGDMDLDGKNFTYTNSLDSNAARYPWHQCPCCVGNIPRTLLMLPTWMYAKDDDGIYVNLFVGSTVTIDDVAGTDVQMVQNTDYPWSGRVSIAVNPATEKSFSIKIRMPDRSVSELYSDAPEANGITSIAVNGSEIKPTVEAGYAFLNRTWKPGDKIELALPITPQRVRCSDKVAANAGRVALRYGPLVYNIESVDQNIDLALGANASLNTQWEPNLLGGVVTIRGTFTDGTTMTAIPNYARNNRGGRSIVWMREER
jgi:DUF1680 family protein